MIEPEARRAALLAFGRLDNVREELP